MFLPPVLSVPESRMHSCCRMSRFDPLNRPWFVGGFNSQVGWSHDEQDDEQIFS